MNQFAVILVIITSLAGGTYSLAILVRLRKLYRMEFLSSLFYYKLLHFTFAVYGILGGLAIREILLKLDLKISQIETIVMSIPFFGIPFIIAAWYLLIKSANDFINRKVRQYVSVIYFIVVTVSFMIYGLILRNVPENKDLSPEILNQLIRIVFYVIDIIVKIYIGFILITAAIRSENKKRRLFLVRYSMILVSISLLGAIVLHFAYLHLYIGLYFMLIFFSADLGLIFLTRVYLYKNASEYVDDTDTIEDLHQRFGISKREKEIIMEICKGKTNQQIADDLFITLQTVKDHTHNIFRKVNVKNRVQLTQIFSGI